MIDRGIFFNEWTALCERFRMTGEKEPSKLMRDRYYAYLNTRIDTDQFRAACHRIYCEAEFFPKPLDFVPAEATKRCAADQWEKLVPLLRNASSPLTSLDEPARRAVRSMGGLAAIGQDESALPFRRSEFLDLYDAFASTSDRLPELTDQSTRTLTELGLGVSSG